MSRFQTSKLSFELLKWILVCSTALTFLGTAVQFYSDYRTGVATIETTLDQIQRSYTSSISNSLWNLDDEQIKIQVNGIIKLKDIEYIKISEKREDGLQVFTEQGDFQTKNVINKKYKLLYKSDNNLIEIGILHVQASLTGLFSRLFDKVLIILVTQTIKTFIVSFCILYIIHVLVSKKINTLVEFAKQLRVKNLDSPILLKRDTKKIDEIDELAKSMNQMRIHLKMSIDKMKKSEEYIIQERDYTKDLINGSPYIICGLTPEGKLNFINPMGVILTGVDERELINSQFFQDYSSNGSLDKVESFFVESRIHEVKGFEIPLRNSSGNLNMISWSTLLRRDSDGVIIEIICFGADITKKDLAEKELKKYQEHLEVLVEKRTFEVDEKNLALEKNIQELTQMQDRLIAQEKLASLGSLTAGIAHELNNPLNFIINFSFAGQENCSDILNELNEKGIEDLEVQNEIKECLAEQVKFNELIHVHGKRAETIIRSMLDHSRLKESDRSEEDINGLIEENINFAFHALKSKYRGFNSKINLVLQPNLCKVNIAKSELGRVFLNMFANAFYALNMKKDIDHSFSPELDVTSKEEDNCVVINIKDNGIGIPKEKLKDVFDPFFTTKPTGEGTGLGLSLSHEIIVGLHHGELDIKSEEGIFTEFIIKLPKSA
ncbi:ATP-binding protein [Halobacteriovorax sp. HLS]|uniref:ATP-binding protein n=1 Tax=Halobacteriovorax sp. HLS TaxID=2234000 RepID=UPI000FD83D0D|nr:ATP-binding protein [Halobacteriovorax sp. HLS]